MTRPAPRSSRGFTFVELLVASVVLGTAFVAATWSMNATLRTKAVHDAADGPALFLANEIHVLADSLPREPAGLVAATDVADVGALDALVGASFSPPVLSDGTVTTSFDGWSQHVSLSVHAISDPETPTADDPAAGIPADGGKLYRLAVLVRHDGQDIDTFHWWINP